LPAAEQNGKTHTGLAFERRVRRKRCVKIKQLRGNT